MSLKVIGAGYGRTGTSSTKVALEMLGLRTYHMVEVPQNKGHLKFWGSIADDPPGTQYDWAELFKDFDVAVDFPASVYWQDQIRAFPDAKVLLTLHPKGGLAWHASCIETIHRVGNERWSSILGFFIPPMNEMMRFLRRVIWGRFLNGTMLDAQGAADQYDKHIAEVIATVPADKLLVYSVTEGWQPLCDLLGVAVPEEDFPRVNDRADMLRKILLAQTLAYTLLGLSIGLGVYILHAVYQVLM